MPTATSDPAVASYLSLALHRLVFLPPDFYFAHPALIAHPVILLAIGLMPLPARRVRKDVRAQFLWGAMLVPLALLFTPAGAWALGQLVTPWELWRLVWVLPIGLALAYLVMLAVENRAGAGSRAVWVAAVWVGIVTVGAVYFAPLDWAETQKLWARPHDVSPQGEELLQSLPRYVTSPSLVLAPLEWQVMMPAYELKAQPATTVTMDGSGLQDFDVDRFYESTLYTDKTVRLIGVAKISFLVLPTSSYLNEQLALQPEYFARVYSNPEYALYRVVQRPIKSVVSTGLRRLEEKEWRAARKKLERAAKAGENPLAFFGLGYAYSELGKLTDAEAALLKAVALAPDLRIAHLKLAELYEQQGRSADAAREFEVAK